MKTFLTLLSCTCFAALSFATTVRSTIIDGITWYYTLEDGKASIYRSDYDPAISVTTEGEIIIPATFDSCPVTSIGTRAFNCCDKLTSVIIPDTVTTIGKRAFNECSELTSVTIPSSVTSIGDGAFNQCRALVSVTFKGKPATLGSNVFYDLASGCKGYYPSTYATEWTAVITNGKWNGLKMEQVLVVTKYTVDVEIFGTGTVQGAGEYEAGETVTLVATPGDNYIFFGWNSTPISMATTYTFTMPAEAMNVMAYFTPEAAMNAYLEAKQLMPKDKAIQEALDADEVFTANEMKELALGAPVIEVKNGVAKVGIQVMKTASLEGEWEAIEEVTVEVTPEANEKAAFYKFVVPEK